MLLLLLYHTAFGERSVFGYHQNVRLQFSSFEQGREVRRLVSDRILTTKYELVFYKYVQYLGRTIWKTKNETRTEREVFQDFRFFTLVYGYSFLYLSS